MEDAREEAEGVLEQVMQKNGEEKQVSRPPRPSLDVPELIHSNRPDLHHRRICYRPCRGDDSSVRLAASHRDLGPSLTSLALDRMIEIYRPDSLIVGTRGKTESMFKLGKGAYMGSISK